MYHRYFYYCKFNKNKYAIYIYNEILKYNISFDMIKKNVLYKYIYSGKKNPEYWWSIYSMTRPILFKPRC